MSVGILLLSHTGIASSVLQVAHKIWHQSPENIDMIEVDFDADTEQLVAAIKHKGKQLDQGDGVMILTDLVGATPCNLASDFCCKKLVIVTGLNLPMLLRAYNYIDKPLEELSELTAEGGRKGITLIHAADHE